MGYCANKNAIDNSEDKINEMDLEDKNFMHKKNISMISLDEEINQLEAPSPKKLPVDLHPQVPKKDNAVETLEVYDSYRSKISKNPQFHEAQIIKEINPTLIKEALDTPNSKKLSEGRSPKIIIVDEPSQTNITMDEASSKKTKSNKNTPATKIKKPTSNFLPVAPLEEDNARRANKRSKSVFNCKVNYTGEQEINPKKVFYLKMSEEDVVKRSKNAKRHTAKPITTPLFKNNEFQQEIELMFSKKMSEHGDIDKVLDDLSMDKRISIKKESKDSFFKASTKGTLAEINEKIETNVAA